MHVQVKPPFAPFHRATLAAAILAASAGIAQGQEVLRAISAFPTTLTYAQSFQRFVDMVNERGQGVVQIAYMGGPEMVPPNQQADAVQRGVVDIQFGPASYALGSIPELDAFLVSPFSIAELRENGGFGLIQDIFRERMGVEVLAGSGTSVQFHIFTINEPPVGADGQLGLGGYRIRSQAAYNAFLDHLGATPVVVPTSDVYTGLERGAFDGAIWTTISIDDLGWNRFLHYRLSPAFYHAVLLILANEERWNALSDEARAIITEVALEYQDFAEADNAAVTAETEARISAAGMTFVDLPEATGAAFLQAANESVWERLRASGTEHYDALRRMFAGAD